MIRTKKRREEKWYEVLNYPKNLEWKNIHNEYRDFYMNFFADLMNADIFFLMNEDKKWVEWYIWMESFAELWFATVQKVVNNRPIDIFILKIPSKEIGCYDEIKIRKELWWIDVLENKTFTKEIS